jgi:hypothetical protein
MTDEKEHTRFVIDIQGLKLSADISRKIESEIRQIVLNEIAKLDLEGDFSMRQTCKEFEKGVTGIWLNFK